MYEDKELEISPAFQRVFVWNEQRRSQFIESLLLELPIPPIYVIEHGEEGHYLLIDGLQRLSSYLHFRGCLTNDYQEVKSGDFLVLTGCDIVPELNGRQWVDLDTALQIRLKRSFVSLQVIRKESMPDLKYHMFKRLNSGGVEISPQQIRNAYVRMLEFGDKLMDFVSKLAEDENFKATCYEVLTDRSKNDQSDINYVLRFFAFKNARQDYVHDIEPFVDSFAESVARGAGHEAGKSFDYKEEERIFRKTFAVLNNSTADKSFTAVTGGFATYHYEAVALGIQSILDRLEPTKSDQMSKLKTALITTRKSPEFLKIATGGGKNTKKLCKQRIEAIETAIASVVST